MATVRKITRKAKIAQAPAVPAKGRYIAYDSLTLDYAAYLDGELVGFGRSYAEAECLLDQTVYELLQAAV